MCGCVRERITCVRWYWYVGVLLCCCCCVLFTHWWQFPDYVLSSLLFVESHYRPSIHKGRQYFPLCRTNISTLAFSFARFPANRHTNSRTPVHNSTAHIRPLLPCSVRSSAERVCPHRGWIHPLGYSFDFLRFRTNFSLHYHTIYSALTRT